MIQLELFLSFFQIGLLSLGGGYAAMPLIQEQVTHAHPWLTAAEFSDLVTIAEMTPGPIGINAASFVGVRLAGVTGSLAASLGFILPGCLVVSVLAGVYRRWKDGPVLHSTLGILRHAVVALIASAGLGLLQTAATAAEGGFDLPRLLLAGGAFLLLRTRKPSPILVMAGCGAVYLLYGLAAGL
ncbi:MAG: chromate transporter [Oscillospiraceae bacterium]|nr:chromate transporter [Oscillospiraceae bacterium]